MPAAAAAATQFSPSKKQLWIQQISSVLQDRSSGWEGGSQDAEIKGQPRHCAENGREEQRGRRSHCGERTVCTTWHTYNPRAAWIKASFINNPWEEGLHNDSWKDLKQNIHGKGNHLNVRIPFTCLVMGYRYPQTEPEKPLAEIWNLRVRNSWETWTASEAVDSQSRRKTTSPWNQCRTMPLRKAKTLRQC